MKVTSGWGATRRILLKKNNPIPSQMRKLIYLTRDFILRVAYDLMIMHAKESEEKNKPVRLKYLTKLCFSSKCVMFEECLDFLQNKIKIGNYLDNGSFDLRVLRITVKIDQHQLAFFSFHFVATH